MSQKILNKRSSVFGKAPLPSQIEVGEIAINFNHENPFLSILDNNGEIQKFLSETKTRGLMQDVKEDIDNSFYTKAETNTLLEAKANSAHTHDYSQILNTPDLSNFATLSDIPSINGLASEVWVGENYQPKGNYLTEHQSLENYYTKSEADNKFLTSHQDLSNYALKSEIPDVSNFVTSAFTDSTYAKKGEVPSDVYTKAETDSKFQPQSGMTDYALKSELPSTTGLASETWVTNNFAGTGHTHSQYAEKTDLANYQPQSGMTDYLTVASASTIYATKEELAEFTPTGSTPSAGYVQNIWVGSLSDYENLTIVDSNTLYCITDEQEQLVTRSYAMNTFATKAMMSDYLTVSAATEMFVEKEAEPLPAYQFVDYIDVSGNTPGIITDYYLTANSVIEFDSEPALANDNMTLYGVTDADWGGMTEGVYAKYGYNLYTYHGYAAESTVQDVPSGRHTFKAGYNYGGEAMAGCQVDDGEIQTCSENYQSWGGQNNLPLGLFGIWSIGSTWNDNLGMKFNGKFYGCKVYEGNTLMRDYVPCVETSTGKVGVFDTLSDSFYETTASASTTVTGSSSAITATTEETTSGETSGNTSGETSGNTSGETTGQTAYTIDTSVYEVGDYIDLNRDTYDLNYLINGDSKFVLDIYLQAGQYYEEMFGIEGGRTFKIGTGESEGSVGLIFGDSQTRNTQYYLEQDGRYVFEMSSGGSVVNGSMVDDWSQAGTVYGMTNSHCHLGGLWQVMVEDWGDGPMDMSSLRGEPYFRMYNFKIYEGNTIIRDYRPVKRLSDDAIGWFDVVNQTFMGRDENNSVGEGASLGYNE